MVLVVKNLPTNAGDIRDAGLIPGLGRSPGGGHGDPLQYSCLENPHGQRSLVCYSLEGHKEANTTEVTEPMMQKPRSMGLPRWYSGKESTCQCRRNKRSGFNP